MKKGQTLVVLEAMKARPSHPHLQSSGLSSVFVCSALCSHLPQRGLRFTLCQSLLICESCACIGLASNYQCPAGHQDKGMFGEQSCT